MIVEFFKRGTGGSNGPIDYFLGKDRDRENAKLLAGNLEEVAELIDSSPYVKRYTAGCLSFLEDDLSDTKKKNLMAAFEKTLFPGLAPEQYRIVWIEHRDKEYIEKNEETGKEKKQRRLELNFLIPNVEITTGKRLQPFYAKADLNRVDDFKSIVNHKYQLFDPDDPINRRSVKIAKNLPQDKKDFISAMNTEVALAITEGLVSDRESLKAWMTDIGLEITRITKNQISVKNPNNPDSKAIPLKGEFYEQNFRHSEKSAELKREASERYRREANSRYADCIERYQKLCKSKSEYHLERYATRDRTDSAELTRQFTEQENEHTSEYKYNGGELEQGHPSDARKPTDANTEHEKGLADIKRIEPSDSRTSEAEKSPFFIEYNSSFDSTYFAYHEHQLRIYQQQQIQRHQSDGSESNLSEAEWGKHEYTEVWRLENSEIMRTSRPDSPSIQQQLRSGAGDELNELRSTIIEDYRRSTASIEATTASTIRSSTAYTGTISDYRRIEAVHENFKRQTPRSSQDSAEISANNARIIRANYLSNIFTNCARELEGTITDTFRQFSREFTDRWTSETSYKEHSAEPNQDRNREANSTIGGTVERENGLSTAISRKVRGFDTENIFKALDELDRRRERRNDRGYDSPSPF